MENNKQYTTNQVATMVGIAVPTVRKYSQHLESKGYVFLKSNNTGKRKKRMYIEKDIETLKYLKKLRNENNMMFEDAINVVINKFSSKTVQRNNDMEKQSDANNRYTEQYDKLKKQIYHQTYLITKQNEIIRELADKINYQQIRLNEGFEQIDDNLNDIANIQKAINPEKDKKNFIVRLFG